MKHTKLSWLIAVLLTVAAAGIRPVRAEWLAGSAAAPYIALAWSPHFSVLAAATEDGGVHLIRTGKTHQTLKDFKIEAGPSGELEVKSLTWTSDRKNVVCLTADGAQVRDVTSGKLVRHVPSEEQAAVSNLPSVSPAVFDGKMPALTRVILPGPQSVDASMSVSPSGRWLAIAHWDTHETVHDEYGDSRSYSTTGEVHIYDINTGKLHRTTKSVSARVLDVVWSADGSTLASNCGDNTIRIWDVRTGKVRRTLRTDGYTTALSPDGALLACAGDARVRLWNTRTGKAARTLTTGAIQKLTFTPPNFRQGSLAWITTNAVNLCNSSSGRRTRTYRVKGANDVAFAPHWSAGNGAVAIASDSLVRLWRL